ncbi:hypothetical protein Q3G72_001324 [Acer saccharum]|nr:hypothetical protein Q3G72_001324 [Acer saccharum]
MLVYQSRSFTSSVFPSLHLQKNKNTAIAFSALIAVVSPSCRRRRITNLIAASRFRSPPVASSGRHSFQLQQRLYGFDADRQRDKVYGLLKELITEYESDALLMGVEQVEESSSFDYSIEVLGGDEEFELYKS